MNSLFSTWKSLAGDEELGLKASGACFSPGTRAVTALVLGPSYGVRSSCRGRSLRSASSGRPVRQLKSAGSKGRRSRLEIAPGAIWVFIGEAV